MWPWTSYIDSPTLRKIEREENLFSFIQNIYKISIVNNILNGERQHVLLGARQYVFSFTIFKFIFLEGEGVWEGTGDLVGKSVGREF